MSHVYKLRHSIIECYLKHYIQNHSQHYLAHIISNLQRVWPSPHVRKHQHPTALCHAELGKAGVLKPKAPTERDPFSLVLNTYWCTGAWLQPAAHQLAAGTPNGWAWLPAHARPCMVGLSSLQSCANRNSRYFIAVPLFSLEGIEKPEMVWQLCPLHFSLTGKPLLAAPATSHKPVPHSSSTCPASAAQRQEDLLITVSLSKHNWLPTHVSFDTPKHPFILPMTALGIPERQEVATP